MEASQKRRTKRHTGNNILNKNELFSDVYEF